MVPPLLTETLRLCSGWVPARSPIPACARWMDADLSQMPFWDVVGIHQFQLLPGLIYSG